VILGCLLLPVVAGAQSEPPMPVERIVEVFGQHIHFYEAGQGPAVIFVHGLGRQANDWVWNIDALAQKFHVYALDQIGFGHSDKPLIDYRIETFVEFLQGFMEAEDIHKATLVGNSLGGWIAADFAAQHPAMIEKLVLVDAGGLRREGPPSTPPTELNPSSLVSMRKILELVFYNKQFVTDGLVRKAFEEHLANGDGYTSERVLAGRSRGDQFEDEKLASIHAPTLVVWGREDSLVPLSVGERYAKGIAGAKLVVLDLCGHVPQIEKAAEFNKALLEFLGR
jgi:pimeloyl-ACP methyl ester carboxylesterase